VFTAVFFKKHNDCKANKGQMSFEIYVHVQFGIENEDMAVRNRKNLNTFMSHLYPVKRFVCTGWEKQYVDKRHCKT